MRCTYKSLILIAACATALAACGGGSSPSASQAVTAQPTSANNVQSIIVDAGPDPTNIPAINEPFTSVTICAPASPTLCQTINHVLVDTGSSGLRLISSVLMPAMASALSTQTTGGSNTLVECTQFVDGYSWGPVRSVNFQIAGESAQGMAMQVIGDPNLLSPVPSDCSSSGPPENTVDQFGANGVIGVGPFQQDCGSYCSTLVGNGNYYTCSPTSCAATSASLAQQVPNPVSLFAADNNGVIISLPTVAAGGAVSVSGTMIFGVGSQSNNALGSATAYQMDSIGNFVTIFNGTALPNSFIDSGSNGLYFPNSTNIAIGASGFYDPLTPVNLSATIQGANKVGGGVINFSIANADSEFSRFPNDAVFVPLGGPSGDPTSFDWGLPFFFGRNVIVVTENKTVGGTTGPFVAF